MPLIDAAHFQVMYSPSESSMYLHDLVSECPGRYQSDQGNRLGIYLKQQDETPDQNHHLAKLHELAHGLHKIQKVVLDGMGDMRGSLNKLWLAETRRICSF
jgi:hypothetical protein